MIAFASSTLRSRGLSAPDSQRNFIALTSSTVVSKRIRAIPQVLSLSSGSTGGYGAAFYGFVAFYVLALVVTWACYLRRGTGMAAHRI